MAFKYNGLVLPFSFWSRALPTHSVTCSLFVSDTFIVTGSKEGIICVWNVQDECVIPKMFFKGHTSPVMALVHDILYEKDCLISVSDDGTLCLWDLSDGTCIKSAENLLSDISPTSMCELGDHERVAVSGLSHQVAIVHISRMKIESHRANHDDWVGGGVFPCSIQMAQEEFIFLSLSNEVLRFWNVASGSHPHFVQTVVLGLEGTRNIFVGPKNITFAACATSSCFIFAAANSHCLFEIVCPFGKAWEGGIYVDSYHVLIWSKEGSAALYRLPSLLKYHAMDFGFGCENVPEAPNMEITEPVLLFSFSLTTALDHDDQSILQGPITCCSNGKQLCMTSERGNIHLFDIPLASLHSTSHIPDTIPIAPIHQGSIKEHWEKYIPPTEGKSSVTASYYVAEQMIQIFGYEDGSITIHHEGKQRKMKQCHQGKVTALLYTRSADESEVLLSGGDDCKIHAWDFTNGDWIQMWPQHYGAILKLLGAPVTNGFGAKKCFLSIANDYSLGLFSYDPPRPKALHMFTGHKAAIQSVQLRLDADYLFIYCADFSVSLWEFSTGSYEGCYSTCSMSSVTEMTMTSLPLKEASPSDNLQSDSEAAITLYSSDVSPPVPCSDVLFLNIRQIIEQNSKNEKTKSNLDYERLLRYIVLMLPWGIPEIEEITSAIGIEKSSSYVSTGVFGDKGKFSLFLPGSFYPQLCSSSQTTAITLLSIMSLSNTLLRIAPENKKTQISQFVSYCCALLPDLVKGFIAPCLGFLTNFWRDKVDDVRQAAKSLFFSILGRQSSEERSHFIADWTYKLQHRDKHLLKSKAIPGIVLGIVASENQKEFNSDEFMELRENVAASLMNLIMNHPDISYQLMAAQILARGFPLWSIFVKQRNNLIIKLLSITTPPSGPGKFSPTEKALFSLALQIPGEFVEICNTLTKQKGVGPKKYFIILRVLSKLIKRIPFSILDEIISMVELLLRSMNPKLPLRAKLFGFSSEILKSVAAIYPMVALDSTSELNRLAVGTQKQICVFDLKNCTRLYTLTGHSTDITAVSFSSDAKTIASMAVGESSIRFWSAGSSGIWFNSPPKCLGGLAITEPLDNSLPQHEFLSSISFLWTGSQTVRMKQGNTIENFQFSQ